MVTGDILLIDVLIYWVITMVVIGILDLYAAKTLGGRKTMAYKVLKMSRFLAMTTASVLSIVFGFLCIKGFEIQASTATFVGVPYFVIWVFFLINVLRRVRAEKHGRR